jgi:hypothetical protein
LPPYYGSAEVATFTGDIARAGAGAGTVDEGVGVAIPSTHINVSIGKRFGMSLIAKSGAEALVWLLEANSNTSGSTSILTKQHGILLAVANDTSSMLMSRNGNVIYAQLNDFTSPVTGNLAVANYGHGTPHYLLAKHSQPRSLRVVAGMDQTQPITLHMWEETGGEIAILAGNLEENFCEGLPCSVPTALTGRTVTVSVDVSKVSINVQVGSGVRGESGNSNVRRQQWVLYSNAMGGAVEPVLLDAAILGIVKVVITLPFQGSKVYRLKPVQLA